jgi:hypothetical protein
MSILRVWMISAHACNHIWDRRAPPCPAERAYQKGRLIDPRRGFRGRGRGRGIRSWRVHDGDRSIYHDRGEAFSMISVGVSMRRAGEEREMEICRGWYRPWSVVYRISSMDIVPRILYTGTSSGPRRIGAALQHQKYVATALGFCRQSAPVV